MVHRDVESRIREELPDRPGIYVFGDGDGKPLYVGKAKSLKKRGLSYLRDPFGGAASGTMLAEARESRLPGHRHRSGSARRSRTPGSSATSRASTSTCKDDKTYPYLKLTMRDDYPAHRLHPPHPEATAPSTSGPSCRRGLARKAIKLVQKLFQVRVCRIPIDGRLPRPCLYHDMHRCLGPCVDGLTTVRRLQRGGGAGAALPRRRNDQLKRELKPRMLDASDRLEFEEAARLRDLLAEARGDRPAAQALFGARRGRRHLRGPQAAGGNAAVTILVMRGGQVLDRRELFWEGQGEVEPARLLSEVLPQIYDRTPPSSPRRSTCRTPIDGDEALVEWLSERKGRAGLRAYCRRAG